MSKRNLFVLLTMLSLYFTSCSPKNIPYFQDIAGIDSSKIAQGKYTEPVIQVDDVLDITIQTIDPKASAPVNQKSVTASAIGASSASSIGQQQVSGFLVDKYGQVEIPIIGSLELAGLTTHEARQLIRERAAAYFVSPTVQVRFANFKVTVIGEVARPATYTVPNEKASILDAIGLAGDLTIYGKRENVLLIREEKDEKVMIRFDLNSTHLFQSPYYYLKQNDVIYVEPNKSKIVAHNAERARTYAIIGSVLSLGIVVATRLF